MSDPFIGQVQAFGFNFAPRGWAFCNGQLLPVAQNTALFSLLGTMYGGDGRSTFGLPNLEGRASMHFGRGPGLTSRKQGQLLGSENVALVQNQLPVHTHAAAGGGLSVKANSGTGNNGSPSNNYPAELALGPITGYNTASNTTMAADMVGSSGEGLSNTGDGQSHTNMQPYLAVNWCICLQGIYPSRS